MNTARRLRRRIAQTTVMVAIAGGLSVGLAGTATASELAPPPRTSVAAPSWSEAQNVGDGRHYWASDACHYFQKGGTWWSDTCLRQVADSSGAIQRNVYGTYQNVGNGVLGAELMQFDLNDPHHFVFTSRSLAWNWYRTSYGDPGRIEQSATTNDGRPIWISLPTFPSVRPGGPPAPTGDAVKDQQIARLWNSYNTTLQFTWLQAAGAKVTIGY